MQIITGIGESEHVTSMQHRAIFEMVIGDNSYILNKGELLEPELQSNNALKIRSGMLAHHGCISEVAPNTYDEVAIGNGSQSMKRIDLVVARYTQNAETKVERTEWTVIQGQPVESNPVAPDYIHGNMQDGDLTDDCPVFEVHLDGIQVVEIKKLLNVLDGSLAELNRKLPVCNEIYSGVANHAQYDIPDITPYDLLVIYGGPGTYANTSMVVPVASIVHKDDGQFAFGVYQSSTTFWELEFNFPSNVKINIANYKNQSWTTPAIRKIVGVKL